MKSDEVLLISADFDYFRMKNGLNDGEKSCSQKIPSPLFGTPFMR